MTDDNETPVPRYVLLHAYEATARKRYRRRMMAETHAWLDDAGPMPEVELALRATE